MKREVQPCKFYHTLNKRAAKQKTISILDNFSPTSRTLFSSR